MRKVITIILVVLTNLFCFGLGCIFSKGAFDRQEDYYISILRKYIKLDSSSRTVIDNSNLLDTDGSDAMADYLEARKEVDDIYKTRE